MHRQPPRPHADQSTAALALLGLAPIVPAAGTPLLGLLLGLVVLTVLLLTCASVMALRGLLGEHALRLTGTLLVQAAWASVAGLVLNAFAHASFVALAPTLPLVAVSITLWGQAVSGLERTAPFQAAWRQGLLVLALLTLVGFGRELAGRGSVLANADQLLGDWAHAFSVQIFEPDATFLVAVLAPGAFLGLGFVLAAWNAWRAWRATARP